MTRVSASALAVDEVFLGARWMLRGRELVRRRRMRGWAPAGGHGGGGKTVLTGYRQVHLPKRCQLTSIKVIAQLLVRVFQDVSFCFVPSGSGRQLAREVCSRPVIA